MSPNEAKGKSVHHRADNHLDAHDKQKQVENSITFLHTYVFNLLN